MSRLAVKVPLALYRAIVFARCVFKLNAYPFACLKGRLANKSYNGNAAIIDLNELPWFIYPSHDRNTLSIKVRGTMLEVVVKER